MSERDKKLAVRDLAADVAGTLLKIELSPKRDWTDEQWEAYRAKVQAALQERKIGTQFPE